MRPMSVLRFLLLALVLALPGGVVRAADPATFGVLYSVWIKPERESAVVKIRLSRNIHLVDWLKLQADPQRYSGFFGTGQVSKQGDEVLWRPPAQDAWLQYRVDLASRRDNGDHDGMITPRWALFRADDLVPPIHSSFEGTASSNAKLQFHLPAGWSVETRYPRYRSGRFKVDDPRRRFDRPTGWLVMGDIGTRRERIGDTRVAVSAPVGQDVRYLDTLAFLRWTLPSIQRLFPGFPERLLVVSAGDPMWRGALSGPGSLYLHRDRPLISGNATSTLVHELIHVAMRARGAPGADWIVEGLAEYYSLEILRRSGAISEARFERAHRQLADWGRDVRTLDVERASGPITARAVGVLREIDREIRRKSDGAHSLDDVARSLAADEGPVTVQRFEALVAESKGGG
ncbi:hypothetical protein [Thiococcus pfennigii]|uniref:hypothetical protein n=1 Tax=Thiococcus pfennigii TaxID=1057 RepID=UPI001906FD15|nr:hypothetical protein [Thiococcus pfennigii]MBK1700837.1 hypothetical protein [Thiococcus pfennigii]MBK1732068.1 hypothetical protein [Thiococcus pfennigii]